MSFADTVRFHCEQSRSDSCVAACATMALARMGELSVEDMPARERLLAESLFPPALARARDILNRPAHVAVNDNAAALEQLQRSLLAPSWCLIAARPEPLHEIQRSATPRPRSRHGFLGSYRIDHAIVLTGFEDNAFHYLDPFFPAQYQPQRLTRIQLVSVWNGQYITVPLPQVTA